MAPIARLGAPGTTRTCDLLNRNQTLYPTELRVHRRSLAEEEGFEPSVHVLRIRLISNEVVSAAHPLLRKGQFVCELASYDKTLCFRKP